MVHCSLLCTLIILLAVPAWSAQKQLTLGMTNGNASPVALTVVTKAYARLDIEVVSQPMPARRSLVEAQNGNSDGEVSRIANIEDQYPDLIRIPVPVDQFIISAITFKSNDMINSLNDIKHLRVGIKAGIQFAEQATAGMANVHDAKDWTTLFNMLRMDRIDVVLATPRTWNEQRKQPGFEELVLHLPQLDSIPLYHYLNKGHADLVPEITRVLKKMRDTGEIQAIRDRLHFSQQPEPSL